MTLALFETLVDLNCEDVMLELVLRHLVPCSHVMLSQRSRVRYVDPYCRSADKLLSLVPEIPRSVSTPGALTLSFYPRGLWYGLYLYHRINHVFSLLRINFHKIKSTYSNKMSK